MMTIEEDALTDRPRLKCSPQFYVCEVCGGETLDWTIVPAALLEAKVLPSPQAFLFIMVSAVL